ncbi:uncharacterized protein [Asterias amurensis]|uniref:uncharacterized protein n=1 Tax=Asterias amurensis TaxID=7602 RepID=UPI003AB42690
MLLASTSVFLVLLSGVLSIRPYYIGSRPGPRDNNPRQEVGSSGRAGLCRFGRSHFGCCYGWKRDNFGGCTPVCSTPCEHGTCIGPNQCRCESGYTGSKCERDLNECSARPCSHRCMNTPGSYRCYCEHGYILLEDGVSCSRDDRCSSTRCSFGCIQFEDGFTCFCPDGLALLPDGLGCTDVDECAVGTADCGSDRRCKNTYGNYMCLCPLGFKFAYVDGELACVDEDECDTNKCDTNAYCINVVGGFDCKCNEGYAGDGYKCVPIDSRTCVDQPCFEGVTCRDVPVTDVLVEGTTTVKQYACGECPPTLTGDGETCNLDSVAIEILTVERSDETLPVGEVNVKVLQEQPDGQTEVIAEGTTNLNGIAKLQVPSGALLEISGAKDDYVDVIKTRRIRSDGVTIVTLPMESFPEHTSFLYRVTSSKGFEFGSVEGEAAGFRLSFPEGALRARDGTTINIKYKGVDVASPEALSALPDLTQIETAEGEPEGQRLIPLGAAELTILTKLGENVQFKKPGSITFLLKDFMDLLGIRDTLDAYFFDTEKGKWVNAGPGTISESEDGPVWKYEATHFTWWMVATTYTPDKSITVRTCYDAACTRPAIYIPIKIYGENFFHYAEYETGSTGTVCADIFKDGFNQVIVEQNCTGDVQIVSADMQTPKSSCSSGEGAGQVVTFVVPESEAPTSCPDPGEPENGIRQGTAFNVGSDVAFYCNPEYRIEGPSQRVCKQCGKWNLKQPQCVDDIVASGQSSFF